MTLRHTNGSGVWAESNFTMKNIIVEHCSGCGIEIQKLKNCKAVCENIEIRYCGLSGISADNGATITSE